MYRTEGVVVELVDDGFTMRQAPDAEPLLVLTMLPGKTLRLQPGDVVAVSGGPGRGRNEWASSGASKRGADGQWVRVRINPTDKADE